MLIPATKTLLLAFLTLSSSSAFASPIDTTPLEARSVLSFNLTTHLHGLCRGEALAHNYHAMDVGAEKCIDVEGKSIKLWKVAKGCKVTANEHLGCRGLIHHRVVEGCNEIDFRSVRVEC